MSQKRSTILLALFAVVSVTTGCRTYGGHGSVEANNAQLAVAVQSLVGDARQAGSELQTLAASGMIDDELIEAFAAVVEEHLAVAESLASSLNEDGSLGYRAASRKLGAVVSTRRVYRDKYQSLLRAMAGSAERPGPERTARYQILPAAYHRAAAGVLTANDVVNALRTR